MMEKSSVLFIAISSMVRLVFFCLLLFFYQISCVKSFAHSLSFVCIFVIEHLIHISVSLSFFLVHWKVRAYHEYSFLFGPLCVVLFFLFFFATFSFGHSSNTNWRFIVSIYFIVTVIHSVYVVFNVFIAENNSRDCHCVFFFTHSFAFERKMNELLCVCACIARQWSRLF